MEYFVYLVGDHSKKHIHAGFTKDIAKTAKFYNKWNDMCFNPEEKYANRLVYLEMEYTLPECAPRLKKLAGLSSEEKQKLISSVNPEWLDLSKDSHFNF